MHQVHRAPIVYLKNLELIVLKLMICYTETCNYILQIQIAHFSVTNRKFLKIHYGVHGAFSAHEIHSYKFKFIPSRFCYWHRHTLQKVRPACARTHHQLQH